MASPLIVQPSAKDNFMRETVPTTNHGTLTYLRMGDRITFLQRPILEFDISALPATQTITAASLELYYYSQLDTDPVGKTVWAYKITRADWVEAESCWNLYKALTSWTTPGGDYVTSTPSGGSVAFPAGYGWMAWNVLAIVQDAYAGSIAAEFIIKFATEDLAADYSRAYWYSNDYTGDTSLCPKLTISYEAAAGASIPIVMHHRKMMENS